MATASSSKQPEQDATPAPEVRIARYDQFYDTRKRTTVYRKTNKNATKKHFQKLEKKKPVLVVRRILDSRGRHASTEVDIRHQKLAAVLRDIYSGVEGREISRSNPSCSNKQLFLALPDLQARLATEMAEKASERDPDLIYGLEVVLEYIQEDFGSVSVELQSLLSMDPPSITFELLWTLFPPGALLYSHEEYTESNVISKAQTLDVQQTRDGVFAVVTSNMITHNGKHFGLATISNAIPMFEGIRKLQDLAVYPLNYYPNSAELCAKAIIRGRKLGSLLPHKYVEVSGFGVYEENKTFRLATRGRAMIDPVSYRSWERSLNSSINHKVHTILNFDKLTEGELMLCYPVVLGFSFTTKRWGGFPLDGLSDVEWSSKPFDSLVFNPKIKELVHSMVKQHSKGTSTFDDVVKGKGKGLVGLLCGPPGGGKTLTAEAVAEATQRPLYCLSAGELGTHPDHVEERLTQVLELAQRWKAVVLLDEADVFLAQRDNTGIERNALVSIFLRKLEYYQGILILTTNLVTHCDSAFESRIHFTVYYPELTAESRRKIWDTFISRASVEHTVTENDLKVLAKEPLNGRQIKNSVAVAESFACGTGQKLSIDHINTVLEMIRDWEKAKIAFQPASTQAEGSNLRLVSFCALTFAASIVASLVLQLVLQRV